MTHALIDNATLTAVQRIQGQIITKGNDSTDTDLVALENLIQAILFYDDIVSIDDYKREYTDLRKKEFNFINFIAPSDFNLQYIQDIADRKSQEIRPEIRGGQFINEDFKKLLELMQTQIICTWNISSSVYHLMLNNLSDNEIDFKKYRNIAAGIFSELTDVKEKGAYVNGEVELVDRFGKRIQKGYHVPGARWGDGTSAGDDTPVIKAFVASLIWLANRSIYYSLVSKHLKADTFLHPIRQTYQQMYISKACSYETNYTRNILSEFASKASNDIVKIHSAGLGVATSLNVPLFSAYIAKKFNTSKEIIRVALSLKNDSEFREARDQLRAVRKLFDESSDLISANRAALNILKDIDKASKDIMVKYGVATDGGIPIVRLIQAYNTCAAITKLPQLPEIDAKIPMPDFLKFNKGNTGFGALYRNIGSDLSTVWSLGEIRDILGSSVVSEGGGYSPKQENPIYKDKHSPFKSPM